MPQLLDARGLLCPLPALKARRALAALAPGEVLVVLATDPEAPVDVGALAADGGHGFEVEREDGGWRYDARQRLGLAVPTSPCGPAIFIDTVLIDPERIPHVPHRPRHFDITGPHSLAQSALPHAPVRPERRRRK